MNDTTKNKKREIIDYGYISQNSEIEPESVYTFDSKESQKYFINSRNKAAFFKLAPHYAPQQHITTCGIASAVIVLNAIYAIRKKKRPMASNSRFYNLEENKIYANFIWNEKNFFTKTVKAIINKNIITGKTKQAEQYKLGLSLSQLAKAINLHGVTANYYNINQISSSSITDFRNLVKEITANPLKFMIVNYHMNIQSPDIDSGHFSPIAAYDSDSDCILVLDTWSSYSPWIWINLQKLYKSMHSLDGDHYRGFILVDVF